MDATIFKSCDIQGVYPGQLSADDAWKIGVAAGRFLPSLIRGYDRGLRNTQSLCVGRDMRTHSSELAEMLIKGIRCAGVSVIDLGQIDTPQIYFAINDLKTCGGIQVTASQSTIAAFRAARDRTQRFYRFFGRLSWPGAVRESGNTPGLLRRAVA